MAPVDLNAALAPQDGLLSVDGARLGSARITAVFTGLLPAGVLQLRGATAQPGRFASDTTPLDAVEVTGTLVPTVLGAPDLAVHAWFFLVDGTADVVATLTGMPDPWTPPVSFAGTAGTAVAGVTFRGCVFTVDSRPRPGLGAAFDAVLQYDTAANTAAASPLPMVTSPTPRTGLSLSATLDLGSLDTTLSEFVQVADTAAAIALPVAGDIEVVGDRPRMRLRTTTPVASCSFQDVTLTVDHEFLTAPMQDAESTVIQKVRERLITTLVYRGASETLTVPLAATFDPESLTGGVILANEPGLGSALSLQTLAGLIPGGVGAAVPTTIPGLDQLALTDFALQVTGWPVTFSSAHARVSAPGIWPIVPGLVEFGGIGIDLTVTRIGDAWQLRPTVLGSLVLAGGRLNGAFDLAAGSWLCVLEDDSPINVRGLLEQTLHLQGLLPDQAAFDVTRFELRGDADSHTVDIATALNWPLQVGTTTFTLQNLFVSLEYAGDGGPTGTLGGTLAIGGVTAVITAAYAAAGLTFEVVAYDLALTNVLADIIGSPALVSQLPAVNFAVLDLAVTPRTGAFLLRARGEIDWKPPFGVPGLAIRDLAVDVTRPAGDGPPPVTASLSGNLMISTQQPYDLTVRADLTTGGGGLRFEGATAPGQEIMIGKLVDDLSVRFGGVTLPAALAELVVLNLHVAIDTAKKSFSFAAETRFPIEGGRTVDATITIDLTQVDGTYTGTFGGQVTVGALGFDLHFARSATVTFCVATYRHLAVERNATPSINVRELIGNLSMDVAAVVPADLQIDLKDVILVLGRTDAGTRCLIGLDVGARLGLSSLPLVGQQFGSDQTASIDDLRLLVATGDLRRSDVTTINGLLPTGIAPLVLPAAATDAAAAAADVVVTSGPTVSATLSLGGTSQSLALPVASPPARTGVTANAPAPSDPTKWFTVQRTFGPVHLSRVGVQYRDSVLWFLLDAALSALGLTLSLDGLGAGSPITRFEPRFTLRGLGVDYKNPAIEIGAAFLHVTVTDAQGRTYDEYDGAAIVKAQGLTLSAIGSYAYLDGHPSLFVYAVLDYPIGGPAFFFVTGLAAGFGYNRALVVPQIDQIAQFPLVSEAVKGAVPPPADGPPPPSPAERVSTELARLRDYLPPSAGDNFLAVGIRFSSFKMLDSFALLTISFGHRVEINVLGLSTLVAPTPIPGQEAMPPLAVIQMAVKASFVPDEGFLGVAAQLTPASYVLSRDCHLTGGFAFYAWFPTPGGAGGSTGDFVLTLGGYHPDFRPPAHYPSVPRLGVNWKVSEQLAVKGEAYFALTPAALMAGVLLDATWDSGDLTAWFHAGADFIVGWKPYHYDAHAFATLRASYRFELFGTREIRVDASADLHLWGPEFSGRASIRVSVVEFDVTFGAAAIAAPDPIRWDEFTASFLPKAGADGAIPCCSVAVTDGLVRKPDTGGADGIDLGIVNPKTFALVANSVIPSTSAVTGKPVDVAPLSLSGVGVAPMAVAPGQLTSVQGIRISLDGRDAEDHFTFTPVVKSVPAALWGRSGPPDVNADRLVARALSGFTIRPKDDVEPATGTTLQRADWQYSDGPTTPTYTWENPPDAQLNGPPAAADTVRSTITAAGPTAARARLLGALGVTAPVDVDASIADELSIA